MLKLINISIFIFLLVSHVAFSQCRLKGTVYYANCSTVESGVTVSLYNYNTSCIHTEDPIATTTSGNDGSYYFDNISNGFYDIIGTMQCQISGSYCFFSHDCNNPASANFCMGIWTCDNSMLGKNTKTFSLYQNFPNPFNPITMIQYNIPKESFVTMKVYDVSGREVKELVNEMQTAGPHSVSFNAVELPSSIYFYTLKAGNNFTETKKMLLIK